MKHFTAIEIKELKPKKLAGMNIRTSFANDKTPELWRNFMPRRKEITNGSRELYSLQVYPRQFSFGNPDLSMSFTKWALLEVPATSPVNEPFQEFNLDGGVYAVFYYKGSYKDFAPAYHFIFNEWLPASGYVVDDRPHFEILGEKYKNDDPDSEEEIWIPIRK